MKIVVRFSDGSEAVQFDSRKDVTSDDLATIYAAKTGWTFVGIAQSFTEKTITDAWLELDNGKKLVLSLAE